MKNHTNKYHRRSVRLPAYDYSTPGAYFVTIYTKDRQCSLGRFEDEKVVLSPVGKITQQIWIEIPIHFSNVYLDEFVIMPNHIHGIIIITDNDIDKIMINIVGALNLTLLRMKIYRPRIPIIIRKSHEEKAPYRLLFVHTNRQLRIGAAKTVTNIFPGNAPSTNISSETIKDCISFDNTYWTILSNGH